MKLKNLFGSGSFIWIIALLLFGMVSAPLIFAGINLEARAASLLEKLPVIVFGLVILSCFAATLYFSVRQKNEVKEDK